MIYVKCFRIRDRGDNLIFVVIVVLKKALNLGCPNHNYFVTF